MSEFEKYSSLEAYQVAEMAKAKDLILLEGNYEGCSTYPDFGDDSCRGYCVVKMIAGQYLTLCNDNSVFQDYTYDGPCSTQAVKFNLTLEEATQLIMNFNMAIKNYPVFFAYVRVYADEPEYYGYLQMVQLEEFARKHGITYEERFVCIGGQQDMRLHPDDGTGIDDVIVCCEKSFSKMKGKNSFLVVSDISRLNDNIDIWCNCFDIISVRFWGLGYTEYYYSKSEAVREAQLFWKKCVEDSEYRRMSQEHRQMMMEQDDQIFIESEEQDG